MSKAAKARGRSGSWLATIDEVSYACVHKFFWKDMHYNDPWATPDQPKAVELAAVLRERNAAILTDSHVITYDDRQPHMERKKGKSAYIALWSIADIEFDENGLRFKFVSRIFDLQ